MVNRIKVIADTQPHHPLIENRGVIVAVLVFLNLNCAMGVLSPKTDERRIEI